MKEVRLDVFKGSFLFLVPMTLFLISVGCLLFYIIVMIKFVSQFSEAMVRIFENFFNWRIIAFQCFVSFCCEEMEIIHKYTYISSLLNLSPTLVPSFPSRLSQSIRPEHPVLFSNFPLAICFTYGNVYVSMPLSQYVSPSPSPTVSTSPFSISTSLFLLCN